MATPVASVSSRKIWLIRPAMASHSGGPTAVLPTLIRFSAWTRAMSFTSGTRARDSSMVMCLPSSG